MFKEPIQMIELKEKYQKELAYREETLRAWKSREGWRSFFRVMTVIFLLAGIAAAAWLFYVNRNATGYEAYIFAGIAVGGTILVLILNGIIRHALSNSCRRAFDKFWKADVRSQRLFDQIKREKVDPVLENQVVVHVYSTLSTYATYTYENENSAFGDEPGVELVSKKKMKKNNPPKLWRGPVSAATAYIDDIEVGAIDVCAESPFTTFKIAPGLHTLKLKIRRDYVDLGKSLELTTPTVTFSVNGDYHVVCYKLDAELTARGVLKYTLKTAEFDDMVSYVREMRNEIAPVDHNKTALSDRLCYRAQVLYRELYPNEETREEYLERELRAYGPEALLLGDVAKKLESSRVDARLQPNKRVEILATLKREKKEN